jgi:hypothetical protein
MFRSFFIDPSGRPKSRSAKNHDSRAQKNPFLVQRQLKGTGRDGKRTRTGTFRASYFTAHIRSSSKEEQADVSDTNFVDAPINIYASPEEGERLIRAFIRIQQPAMRAAIIRLATQMALIKD